MKSNIKHTLKLKLFDSPKPLVKKSVFIELSESMFPFKNDFIDFLTETNNDRITELAKRIILQFSYEKNFFPSSKLIFNLLLTESGEEVKSMNGYIHNDHFVHKVHLYLLGLYLFFYHESIHKSIIDQFRIKRFGKQNKPLKLSEVIMDILEALKFFVFFHDIGYPVELFLGKNIGTRANEEIYSKYLESFNKISESIEMDFSVKLYTNLIVYNSILNHSKDKTFENIVLAFDDEMILFESKNSFDKNSFSNKIKESKELDKIFGKFSLRLVLSFVDRKNIICVLKRNSFDEPLIIVSPNGSDGTYKILRTNYCPQWKYSDNDIILSAYNNNNDLKPDSYWSYYCTNIENPLHSFKDFTTEKFNTITKELLKKTPVNFSIISNESDFKYFCFEVYYSIIDTLKLYDDDDDNESLTKLQLFYRMREPVFSRAIDVLPNSVSSVFKNLFKERLEKTYLNTKSFDLEKVLFDCLINITGNEGQKGIKKLVNLFSDKIEPKIIQSINSHISIMKIWKELRSKIKKKVKDSSIELSFSGINNSNEDNFGFKELTESQNDLIKRISEKLEKNGLGNFDDVLKYYPKYMKKENRSIGFDHGIISAILAIDAINIHEEIYELSDGDKFLKYTTLFNDIFRSNLDLDHIKDVLLESVYAILTHNIFPADYAKPFKTNLKNTPFAYLCILADSLQPWDRKKSINNADKKLPYIVVSNQFNIEIIDNKIYITEVGNGLDMVKRYKSIKEDLDNYLEEASDIIRTSLSEL